MNVKRCLSRGLSLFVLVGMVAACNPTADVDGEDLGGKKDAGTPGVGSLQNSDPFAIQLKGFQMNNEQVKIQLGHDRKQGQVKYLCKLNAQEFQPCNDQVQYPASQLKNGDNSFQAKAQADDQSSQNVISQTFVFAAQQANSNPNVPVLGQDVTSPSEIDAQPGVGGSTSGAPVQQQIQIQQNDDKREVTFDSKFTQRNYMHECAFGDQGDQWSLCFSPVKYDNFGLKDGKTNFRVRAVRFDGLLKKIDHTSEPFSLDYKQDLLGQYYPQSIVLNKKSDEFAGSRYDLNRGPDALNLVEKFANKELQEIRLLLVNLNSDANRDALSTVTLYVNGRAAKTLVVGSGINEYKFQIQDWAQFMPSSFLDADIKDLSVEFKGPSVYLASYGAAVRRNPRLYKANVSQEFEVLNQELDLLKMAGLTNDQGQLKSEFVGKTIDSVVVTMASTSQMGASQINIVENGPVLESFRNYAFLANLSEKSYRLPVQKVLGTDLSEFKMHPFGRVFVRSVAVSLSGQRAVRIDPAVEAPKSLEKDRSLPVTFNIGFTTGGVLVGVSGNNARYCGRKISEVVVVGRGLYQESIFNFPQPIKVDVTLAKKAMNANGQEAEVIKQETVTEWMSPMTRSHTFQFKDMTLECNNAFRISQAFLKSIGGTVLIDEVYAVIEP